MKSSKACEEHDWICIAIGVWECRHCGEPFESPYSVPQVNVREGGHFNHGLGKYIKNRQGVKDAMKQHKDETGNELVQVGNEKMKTKVKKNDYRLNQAEKAYVRQRLNGTGI